MSGIQESSILIPSSDSVQTEGINSVMDVLESPKTEIKEDILRNKHYLYITLTNLGMGKYELDKIKFAYGQAKKAHNEQYRKSGERYFEHIRSVVTHLVTVGVLDVDILCAAILHDVVEDTGIYGDTTRPEQFWIEDVAKLLADHFGEKVAIMVLNLTKTPYEKEIDRDYWTLERIEMEGWEPVTKAEHDRFYIERLSKSNIGTILVKLADRLHNLETQDLSNIRSIQKIVHETEQEYYSIFRSAADKSVPARALFTKVRLQVLRLKKIYRDYDDMHFTY